MLASFPPPDSDFNSDVSAHAWWIGEKYDGVRLCWNASRNVVFSRTGKTLKVNPPMLRHLPSANMCIDGELWFGRGQFSHACLLFLGTTELVNWTSLRALLFDISTNKYQQKSFEIRYAQLLFANTHNNPFGIVAPRMLCESAHHLNAVARSILADEGEGIILRKVGSLYSPGRSQDLLKLKKYQGDQEGIVVQDQPVILQLASGHTMPVPSQNIHVRNLQIGDIVTFSFESNFRKNLPANPQILKIRSDLSWQDVINSFRTEQHSLNAKSKIKGFSSGDEATSKTAKIFLASVAKSCGKDPLLPETWYSLYGQFSSFVVKKFRVGYFRLLRSVFPEIRFDADACRKLLWRSIGNRREFFENYAKRNRFDALNPENWYTQSIGKILAAKGAVGVVKYHGNSVPQALRHLFPDIGFISPGDRKWWSDIRNARKIMEKFAHDNKFDAHNAEAWHAQPRKNLLDVVGTNIVAKYFGGVTKALLTLFPDIGLDRVKFQLTYYKNISHRRKFFEQYALGRSMDPHKPQDWYDINMYIPGLMSVKGIEAVLFYHGASLVQAIFDLFPNIGLEKSRLHASYMAGKRRRRFENFAKEAGFDPLNPENWYAQSHEHILAAEGVLRAITYHDNSVSKALADLFPTIGFDELKFHFPTWRDVRTRRKFFENYAYENGIDPTNPYEWYTSKALPQETTGLLVYHNNSVQEALVDLFPELQLNKTYFDPKQYWSDSSNRRRFFVNYAKVNGIDPFDPNSWSTQPISRILASRGANKVMAYHSNVLKALCELFPEVGFTPRKLQLKYS